MEGDDPARLDRDRFSGARITPWPRGFGANLKIAKAGYLDVRTFDPTGRDEVEERIDPVLGFTFVLADLLEQQLCQLRLGQCRRLQAFYREFHASPLPSLLLLWRPDSSGPLAGANGDRQLVDDRLHGALDMLLGQRSVVTIERQAHRQAFFAGMRANNSAAFCG